MMSKELKFIAFGVFFLTASCDYQRNYKGSFVVDGHRFYYDAVSTEHTNPLLNDRPRGDVVHTVRYPDGTTESFDIDEDYVYGTKARNDAARTWLDKNRAKANADRKPIIEDSEEASAERGGT